MARTERPSPASYSRMIHDSLSGPDDLAAARAAVDTILTTLMPDVRLIGFAVHDRGGFAAHFNCPDAERMTLATHLEDGGFRQVI